MRYLALNTLTFLHVPSTDVCIKSMLVSFSKGKTNMLTLRGAPLIVPVLFLSKTGFLSALAFL